MKRDYPNEKREPYFNKGHINLAPFFAIVIVGGIFLANLMGNQPAWLKTEGACVLAYLIWCCTRETMIYIGKWKRTPKKTWTIF